VKRRLGAAGLPVMPSQSHIVPLLIGDPVRCRGISDALLDRHRIYVQPINYPTVPRRTERLRLTPSPVHSDADIDTLVNALADVWESFNVRATVHTMSPAPQSSKIRSNCFHDYAGLTTRPRPLGVRGGRRASRWQARKQTIKAGARACLRAGTCGTARPSPGSRWRL
jgi:hypothetical protein